MVKLLSDYRYASSSARNQCDGSKQTNQEFDQLCILSSPLLPSVHHRLQIPLQHGGGLFPASCSTSSFRSSFCACASGIVSMLLPLFPCWSLPASLVMWGGGGWQGAFSAVLAQPESRTAPVSPQVLGMKLYH